MHTLTHHPSIIRITHLPNTTTRCYLTSNFVYFDVLINYFNHHKQISVFEDNSNFAFCSNMNMRIVKHKMMNNPQVNTKKMFIVSTLIQNILTNKFRYISQTAANVFWDAFFTMVFLQLNKSIDNINISPHWPTHLSSLLLIVAY